MDKIKDKASRFPKVKLGLKAVEEKVNFRAL